MPSPSLDQYPFLLPAFLAAMNDIGRYGHEKYGEQSFQHRRSQGDRTRGALARCQPQTLADHAQDHFSQYLQHVPHDRFGTDIHQLAATAFNCMMEAYFAGLTEADEIEHASKEPSR